MIEPLSALVLNSLLSTRGHCSSVQSAGRAIVSSKRSNVTPNFFTPAPRRFKGKGKAVDALASECDECAEWAAEARDERCCAGKHSLWCSSTFCSVLPVALSINNVFRKSHPRDDERNHTDAASVVSPTTTSPDSCNGTSTAIIRPPCQYTRVTAATFIPHV